jgi:hypothetical protein
VDKRERARYRTTRRGRGILDQAQVALPDGVEADEHVELGIAVTGSSELEAALMVVGSSRQRPSATPDRRDHHRSRNRGGFPGEGPERSTAPRQC